MVKPGRRVMIVMFSKMVNEAWKKQTLGERNMYSFNLAHRLQQNILSFRLTLKSPYVMRHLYFLDIFSLLLNGLFLSLFSCTGCWRRTQPLFQVTLSLTSACRRVGFGSAVTQRHTK